MTLACKADPLSSNIDLLAVHAGVDERRSLDANIPPSLVHHCIASHLIASHRNVSSLISTPHTTATETNLIRSDSIRFDSIQSNPMLGV
jgi:hypothetical protein